MPAVSPATPIPRRQTGAMRDTTIAVALARLLRPPGRVVGSQRLARLDDQAAVRQLARAEAAGCGPLDDAARAALLRLLDLREHAAHHAHLADALVAAAGLTNRERELLYRIGADPERLACRLALLQDPRTPLRFVRRALGEGWNRLVWNAAAKHPGAVRDPVCRAMLAQSGNPHVLLALTLAAEPAERGPWLARLAEASPRVAARAVERGDFAGWALPANVLAALLGDGSAQDRLAVLTALPHLTVGPDAGAVARPAGGPRRRRR